MKSCNIFTYLQSLTWLPDCQVWVCFQPVPSLISPNTIVNFPHCLLEYWAKLCKTRKYVDVTKWWLYLYVDVVIVLLGQVDEDSKQGQDRVLDEEEALWPHNHKGKDHQGNGRYHHHPRTDSALPVPLCNRHTSTASYSFHLDWVASENLFWITCYT